MTGISNTNWKGRKLYVKWSELQMMQIVPSFILLSFPNNSTRNKHGQAIGVSQKSKFPDLV